MSLYLVIDNEEKTVEQTLEALKSIDAQAQIKVFNDFTEFDAHLNTINPEDLASFWVFDLMVLNYSTLTHTAWSEKISKLKAQNTKEFSIVLTGYENAFTTSKYIRPLEIYNFIFKPFDTLILKESLNLALKTKKRAQPLEVKSQSTKAFIALLKQVDLQTISEIGFVTISDAQIEVGSISKYFSPLFLTGKKQSLWAQCLTSIAHPQKPGIFINKFQFYAPDQPMLHTLRKYVATNKANHITTPLWNFNPPKSTTPLKLALIGLDTPENKDFVREIQNRYTNLTAEVIKLDPSKKTSDAAIYDHHLCINMTEIKFETFSGLFPKDCVFFLHPQTLPKEDDLKQMASEYRDIFTRPLDRSYFFKKLKTHINALNEKEPNQLTNITTRESLKVASKVKISEISELYVNLIYSRELPFKEFREFVFIAEDESQNVELPAFCHHTEKHQGNGNKEDPAGYLHQFVFFAMTDYLFKQIRLWLLKNYISSNQKNN